MNFMSDSTLDYKSAGKARPVASLDVPPDLTQLQSDNRYAVPGLEGTATASSYNLQQGARPTVPTGTVALNAVHDMHVERVGSQRWLVVKQAPEVLWPQLKSFWQELGFVINIDSPEVGVMETDWAENRAKIPQDFIRNTLGKVLDSLYSTGERDKFRTRLERAADGSTEIYISHRGAQEVLTGSQKDSSVWTPRASDPELEAELLSRLMTRLGAEDTSAKATVANAVPQAAHAKLVKEAGGSHLDVDEGFDRAWRRVGLALDRVGFTVEDRDRNQGLYYVRYVDQGKDAKSGEQGFFSRLFSSSTKEEIAQSQRYRVSVKGADAGSKVMVLNHDGVVDNSVTADKILSLLNEQLK